MIRRFMHYKDSTRPQTIPQLSVRGNRRGALQQQKELLVSKWTKFFHSVKHTQSSARLKQFYSTERSILPHQRNLVWRFGRRASTGQSQRWKKVPLVFKECLSQFLRVEPINNKSAKQTRAALDNMTLKQIPEKIGLTKEKSSRGNLQIFAWRKTLRCTVLIVSRNRVLRSAIFEHPNQNCSNTCMNTTRVSTLIKFKTLSV